MTAKITALELSNLISEGLEEREDYRRFGMPDWLYIDLCCEVDNDDEYPITGENYL